MKKALVVGIDNYNGKSDLCGCVNDAKAIKEVLIRNEDQSKNFDVQLISNNVTISGLSERIQELFKGDCESAIFYFSGHGHVDNYGKASLVTPDMEYNAMGIPMDDVLNWANNSKIKHRIIILDCCFSGSMGNFSGDSTHSSLHDGVTILTASKSDEPSIEFGGHGLFTSLLLEALKGGASDLLGFITPGSIYSYIDKALGPWEQRPVFKSNVSRFDVIRKVNPLIDNNLLRELPKIFDERNEIKLDPSFEYTNTEAVDHKIIEPYANEKNVELFKKLQKFNVNGLVKPVGEEHMYFAAMNSKSCKLTALGKYYRKLAQDEKF